MFGLSENAENFVQEGGRPMRGSEAEIKGKQGYAFYLHKGSLGKGYLKKKYWNFPLRA